MPVLKKKDRKKKDNADANTHSAIVMRYTDIRGVTNSARKKPERSLGI
jgi:hypothetical protein